jgi:tetratricopeptide (TPR) repeat protein
MTRAGAGLLLAALASGTPAEAAGSFAVARLENGLSVGFALVRTDGTETKSTIGEAALARSNGVSRVLMDRSTGAYFGYRLTAENAAGRVRVAFEPLAGGIESELGQALPCPGCPPPNRLATSPRFPPPRLVADGEVLSLELLANPSTGQRILDLVQVSRRPVGPEDMEGAASRTVEAWRAAGRAAQLAATRSPEAALLEYRKATELMPNDAYFHNMMGVLHQQLEQTPEARSHYDRALVLNPRYAEAWNNLGTVEHGERHLKQAIRAYRKAVELKPTLATAWKNLGSAYLAQDRVNEGLDAYRQAFRSDPSVLESRSGTVASGLDPGDQDFFLAKMFAATGQLDRALEFLLRARANGFRDWGKVSRDRDFAALSEDARFKQLLREASAAS